MFYHKNIYKKFRLDIIDINIENSNIFKFIYLNLKIYISFKRLHT